MPPDDETATLRGARQAPPPGNELGRGAVAGDYVIEKVLARGGCGTVYVANHLVLGRRAAVKVLNLDLASSAEMNERFVREARAVNLIRHPNIVDIYDFGQLADGRPFFVMELLEGETIDTMLDRVGRLQPAQAMEVFVPLASALHAAHAAGVIHRDVKASNVMIAQQRTGTVVKLLDFGIAKLLETVGEVASITTTGSLLGTPQAMAPEQIRGGAVDARTDIYALGVLLYRMLTGVYPFRASDPVEVERLHLESPPPRPSELHPELAPFDPIITCCLEKDPARRYPDVPALLAAVRAATPAPA